MKKLNEELEESLAKAEARKKERLARLQAKYQEAVAKEKEKQRLLKEKEIALNEKLVAVETISFEQAKTKDFLSFLGITFFTSSSSTLGSSTLLFLFACVSTVETAHLFISNLTLSAPTAMMMDSSLVLTILPQTTQRPRMRQQQRHSWFVPQLCTR